MDPRQFLDRVLSGMFDLFGQPVIPPSRETPDSSMRGIPFGPYQPLINEAQRVKDELNEQTRRKEQFIREQLGR